MHYVHISLHPTICLPQIRCTVNIQMMVQWDTKFVRMTQVTGRQIRITVVALAHTRCRPMALWLQHRSTALIDSLVSATLLDVISVHRQINLTRLQPYCTVAAILMSAMLIHQITTQITPSTPLNHRTPLVSTGTSLQTA